MSSAVTIDRFLSVAAGQIGGYYPGESPYGVWYAGKVGAKVYRSAQYCAMFVSWCADRAGILGETIPLHAYTPSGANWFRARGRFTSGVKGIRRGDIWYSSCSGLGRISHVGIVERVYADGSFDTIEGNTSVTAAGSQNNGRRVARKRRNTACSLGGYGRPDYSATAEVVAEEKAPAGSESLPAATAQDLKVQKRLRALGLYLGDLDGRNGTWQKSAVAAYQRRQNKYGDAGLVEDGVWGAKTEAWYQWVIVAQKALTHYKGVKGRVVADGDYGPVFRGQVTTVQTRNKKTKKNPKGLVVDGILANIMAAWMRGHGSTVSNRPKTK